jgi:hypothetical protein
VTATLRAWIRAAVVGLSALVVAGAHAAPAAAYAGQYWHITPKNTLGILALSPTTGDLLTPIQVTSAGSCPQGTHSITRLFGPKLPDDGENVIGNTPIHVWDAPPENRLTSPIAVTLDQAGKNQVPPVTLEGNYTMVMDCQEKLLHSDDEVYNFYVGKLRIHNQRYTATTTKADLPKEPVAVTGQEAIDYAQQAAALIASAASNPPTPILPNGVHAAGDSSGHSNSAGIPVAVAVAVVVLGTGGLFVSSRRSKTTAKR